MKPDPSMYEMVGKFFIDEDEVPAEEYYVFAILEDDDGYLRPYVVNSGQIFGSAPTIALRASAKLDEFKQLRPTRRRMKAVLANIFNIGPKGWKGRLRIG